MLIADQATTWCCVDGESCPVSINSINICIGAFDNPLSGMQPAAAFSFDSSVLGTTTVGTARESCKFENRYCEHQLSTCSESPAIFYHDGVERNIPSGHFVCDNEFNRLVRPTIIWLIIFLIIFVITYINFLSNGLRDRRYKPPESGILEQSHPRRDSWNRNWGGGSFGHCCCCLFHDW